MSWKEVRDAIQNTEWKTKKAEYDHDEAMEAVQEFCELVSKPEIVDRLLMNDKLGAEIVDLVLGEWERDDAPSSEFPERLIIRLYRGKKDWSLRGVTKLWGSQYELLDGYCDDPALLKKKLRKMYSETAQFTVDNVEIDVVDFRADIIRTFHAAEEMVKAHGSAVNEMYDALLTLLTQT